MAVKEVTCQVRYILVLVIPLVKLVFEDSR